MNISNFGHLFKSLLPKEKLIVSFSLMGVFSCLVFSVISYLSDNKDESLILLLLAVFMILPLVLQIKTRNSFYGSVCLIFFSAFAIAIGSGFDDGFEDASLYWYSILPLIGGMLLQKKGILVGTSCSYFAFALYSTRDAILGINIPFYGTYLDNLSGIYLFTLVVASICWQFVNASEWMLIGRTEKINILLKIVSHDISNSLMVVQGLSQHLLENFDHEEQVKFALGKISKSAINISNILERVRCLQSIKSDNLMMELQSISIKEVFQSAISTFETQLHKKKIKLILEIDQPDLYFIAEPVTFINEVLNNLISNAIKFSHPGSKVVVGGCRENDLIHITVRDFGIGISRQLKKDLFNNFKPTSRKGTQGEEGTGFGLPIARFLVLLYGGYIEVESKDQGEFPESSGTCFHIFLKEGHKSSESQSLM